MAPTINPRTKPGITEAHIGFGRMHIDVNKSRIKIEEKHDDWMPVARNHIGIGAAYRAPDLLVADGASVHIGKLLQAVGAIECRNAGKARQAYTIAHCIDSNGVFGKLLAEHLRNALQHTCRSRAGCGKIQRCAVASGN